MLSEKDIKQFSDKGMSVDLVNSQLERFVTGFPYLKIVSAATVEKGVVVLSEVEKKKYEDVWSKYIIGDKTITKFVPASGAASRMFKDLFGFLDASYNIPTTDFEKEFFSGIEKFAFFLSLDKVCLANEGQGVKELISVGSYKVVVENLLYSKGLNYGNLPKGLLEFHKYTDETRTPTQEHMVEGSLYASNSSGKVNLHFTVSPEHRELFEKLISVKRPLYEAKFDVAYNVSFSEQKSSTDTIAVNMDNTPFREDDRLLFRPGGHGALIENLNDIDSDIVFVKNIDNTIPDSIKAVETQHKRILAGVLVDVQAKAFAYLVELENGSYSHDGLIEMLYFLQDELNVKNPETKYLEDAELALYIKSKLDRPMRVCGMVRNEGEPGGGPFLTTNADGTISLQILESSQIDMANVENQKIVEKSTYFNPVDLICAVKNHKGERFDLLKYVDLDTGFISSKSKDGKALKALELPGLWNGAMSDWNTIFVEVPIETFNPVKTVNDLLRTNHLC